MKNFAAITAAALCILALAIGAAVPSSRVSGERLISDARHSYRSADLVVSGLCVNNYTSSDNSNMSGVEITEVMAGSAKPGKVLPVQGTLDVGREYLLYLGYGEDVPYAEDQISYVQVSKQTFEISGDKVEYGGSSISLDLLREDMAKLDKTVIMPPAMYYYDTLEELMAASESVFIGRVRQISPAGNTRFRSQAGGSTVEKTAISSNLEVDAYGSVKGTVKYGDIVSLIYCVEGCDSVLNGSTLLPHPCSPGSVVPMKEGGTYLFFIDHDPDPKQDHCFPINPIQGWIGVEGDALVISHENRALSGYSDLGDLVSAMNTKHQG